MHKINHHNRNPYRKPDAFPELLLSLPMLTLPPISTARSRQKLLLAQETFFWKGRYPGEVSEKGEILVRGEGVGNSADQISQLRLP